MPAWKHSNTWTDEFYKQYRDYVRQEAPKFEKTKKLDCADLSIKLLIDFAASKGLPVTFKDVDENKYLYISKAMLPFGQGTVGRMAPWFSKESFTETVIKFIQTKSLWIHSTVKNPSAPEPGDLLMKYSTSFGFTDVNHTALVFEVYPPGLPHPKANPNIPSFPGGSKAMSQFDTTEYFMGTVKDYMPRVTSLLAAIPPKEYVTDYRTPDVDIHFDYLNSRGDKKRNAELIYYANYKQLTVAGFEFRKFAPAVLDNWSDWDGNGVPPRGLEA